MGAQFSGDAWFGTARFQGVSVLGPLVCAGQVVLSRAVSELPVTLEIAAGEVVCGRSSWESTATVRTRYAAVNLGHTVLTAPAAVIARPTPFTSNSRAVSEDLLAGPGARPPPLRPGAGDFGAGRGRRAPGANRHRPHRPPVRRSLPPRPVPPGRPHHLRRRSHGWRRRGMWPVRFTRRRVLAEEHHWRAHTAGQAVPSAGMAPTPHLWRPGPHHTDPVRTSDPEDVAALYRQMRKAFEDGKNEPGAADFYYGECEMRRHDTTGTSKGERRLLWAYWLLTGYGLRAARAFAWLLATMSLPCCSC